MSLDEYKKLKEERLSEGEKANAHYKSVNLPGDRSMEKDTEALRQRIAEMKKEREKPNHD